MRDITVLLKRLKIRFLVFSYRSKGLKKFRDLNYLPWETQVNIASRAKDLTDFVEAFADGKVLLLGHSQGGNLIAHWVCNHGCAFLDRVAGAFFLACPLDQPEAPDMWEDEDRKAHQNWMKAVDGYAVERTSLAKLLRNRIVAIRCWRDGLAPSGSASLLDIDGPCRAAAELVIGDAKHATICGHEAALSLLTTYIGEFSQ